MGDISLITVQDYHFSKKKVQIIIFDQHNILYHLSVILKMISDLIVLLLANRCKSMNHYDNQ